MVREQPLPFCLVIKLPLLTYPGRWITVSTSAIHEWRRNNYLVTTDREKLDVSAIHQYLTRSTWAKGIELNIVSASIDNSAWTITRPDIYGLGEKQS